MTPENKLRNILLSTTLGPIGLFNGVIEGECECGKPAGEYSYWDVKEKRRVTRSHTPGKHPIVKKDWRSFATTDHDAIRKSFAEHPNSNWARNTRIGSVVLDLDNHDGKDGAGELHQMEVESGQAVPLTVTSRTGSGGAHLHFNPPPNIELYQRPKGMKGIDFLRNSAALVPGSSNLSGEYTFLPGLSPDDIAIADMPDWLLERMRKAGGAASSGSPASYVTMEQLFADLLLEGPPAGSLPHGRLRSDKTVLMWMRHVPMRRYPDDRSHSDSHWAWTLAFYCAHHWDQYLRLWRNSHIRALNNTKCGRAGYERSILINGFVGQRGQWKNRKPRVKGTRSANPKLLEHMNAGKAHFETPKSPLVVAIIDLHYHHPELADAEIAATLRAYGLFKTVTRRYVTVIRGRYPQHWKR